ncbi:hypothetical protein CAFE_18550 [Caprobacter fermentans]|uniref:Uncharacterized protein n=1 Tax=Caproicibacter fermentans TaxID=2576756 RepID=A0A6N8I057_9FIRM|nr:hypothetical protein [Caproicibacter fermentans]MVB11150.1 hypothetical protein [Caproicibacter fermentans]
MEELKSQESEALDIIESLIDVADMKCTGPLYADDPPRSGMCRIPEEDAAKLRQYIADRRAAPENKALTVEQLKHMGGEPVWVESKDEICTSRYGIVAVTLGNLVNVTSPSCFFEWRQQGKTWLAYSRKPEGSET